ncbi:hypothetical protein IGB42_02703 [Andreprevotia sp. IGB-42]|uniref:hypothetical protein n=1 Tax=Andreprevotia sp. IGB-42 TaxID=2497473 RepID=UPI00135B1B4A|nr:hypothetical protein [Andreprevotia sp. IGB-42]KAF0812859.1 hypothetical protein IGB42_02703 [Andreprevotia sp. IGB-42]
MELAALTEQVALALQDEADFEATLAALDQQISVQPDSAALYRLRAQLHAAAYDRVAAWTDLLSAAAIAPDDADLALALASLQYRAAAHIAEHLLAGDAPEDDSAADENNEDGFELGIDIETDPQADEKTAALQQEALASLQRLMKTHAADEAFALQLLATWEDLPVWQPWQHYTLILTALAQHPHSRALQLAEARYLASLASACAVNSDDIPSGYFEDLTGNRYHALTVERALQRIDALLADASDAALLESKAALLAAQGKAPETAAAHAQLADLYDLQWQDADEETADELQAQRDEALAQAGLYRQGMAAVLGAQLAQMQEAVDQLKAMQSRYKNDAASGIEEIDPQFAALSDTLRVQAEAFEQGPSAAQYQELAAVAQQTAQRIVATIDFTPTTLLPLQASDLPDGVAPWFAEIAPELHAAGLTLNTLFDNPANTRALNQQCQGQLWSDPQHHTAFTAETARTVRLKRLLSTLSDGTLLLTADSRSSSFFGTGPYIDSISVDKDTPVQEMAELHLARLARKLAATPGLHAVPVADLPQLQALENQMRLLKIAFRFDAGITDAETRGMHMRFHDEFAALLQAEVTALIAPLKERHHG